MLQQTVETRAQTLCDQIVQGLAQGDLATLSTNLYDTAWVSMVSTDVDGERRCLFLETLDYVLKHQAADGGWSENYTLGERILTSLASCLALERHRGRIPMIEDLDQRITRAYGYLQDALKIWDPFEADLIGTEVIVPALIEGLAREGSTKLYVDPELLKQRDAKLSIVDPSIVYGPKQCTLLFSLEAFEGRIDYDRVAHQKVNGGMMGSPASTAAYLLHASRQDDDAIEYLRRAIDHGSGKGNGAVGSPVPAPTCEVIWMVSVLLDAGIDIGASASQSIGKYLHDIFTDQDGVVGFAPSIEPDADDTARGCLILRMLGYEYDVNSIVKRFGDKGHIRSYTYERTSSLTVNCNALRALLTVEDPRTIQDLIVSVAQFICNKWMEGKPNDKWNLSPYYSMMLIAETMVDLVEKWDIHPSFTLEPRFLTERVYITLLQIIVRVMSRQNKDGSWHEKHSQEVTAYAILALKAASRMPGIEEIRNDIDSVIERGRAYLAAQEKWDAQKIFIGKVPYGSAGFCEAYCVAALAPTKPIPAWSENAVGLLTPARKSSAAVFALLSQIPQFQQVPKWKIHISILEGLSLLPRLVAAPLLPQQTTAKNTYMIVLPCAWTLVNNVYDLFIEASTILEMMILNVHFFRVDECMETEFRARPEQHHELRALLETVLANQRTKGVGIETNGHSEKAAVVHSRSSSNGESWKEDFISMWDTFVCGMLAHPCMHTCGAVDHHALLSDLRDFLLSQIQHNLDSRQLTHQANWSAEQVTPFDGLQTLHGWLADTGRKSLSPESALSYLLCFHKPRNGSCLWSPREYYLAREMTSHLAVMSRLYNDYGSARRDLAEGSLNTINFREVHGGIETPDFGACKRRVLELAELERAEMNRLLALLTEEVRKTRGRENLVRSFTLVVRMAEVSGDIYVLRDISNSAT